MAAGPRALFDLAVWQPALEKFGAVTHLTVALYGADGQLVYGPAPATPLCAVFEEHGYDPGLFAECVRRCLAQTDGSPRGHRRTVARPGRRRHVAAARGQDRRRGGGRLCARRFLPLRGRRAARAPGRRALQRLWDLARHQQPVPARRLVLHGELLQVLGDTLLRENHRARQYEETAAQLTVGRSPRKMNSWPCCRTSCGRR